MIAIHGTDSEVTCLRCGRREPREIAQRRWESGVAVPCCPCGAPWKPATISFGQSLVADDLERSLRAAAECDLFVAAGSTLVVGPINGMFPLARAARAKTAILTASETPFDEEADFRSTGAVERVLPALLERVLG
jgi:NAD-dependent deacetylase